VVVVQTPGSVDDRERTADHGPVIRRSPQHRTAERGDGTGRRTRPRWSSIPRLRRCRSQAGRVGRRPIIVGDAQPLMFLRVPAVEDRTGDSGPPPSRSLHRDRRTVRFISWLGPGKGPPADRL